MTDTLLITVLSNALVAGLLAVVVALVSLRVRRASILHVLWIAVLLRLVAPSIVPIPVLPHAAMPEVGVEMTAIGLAGPQPVAARSTRGFDVQNVAVVVWLTGALILGSLFAVRIRRMHHIVGRAAPAPAEMQAMAETVAARFAVSPPELLLSDEKMPPALWAIGRRPRIVLPAVLARKLDSGKVESLLAHETAHLVRRDHWVRWVELLVTTLCWWNPIAWVVSRQVRRAEERSCDEKVVATFPDNKKTYAESLITTLRFLSTATTSRVPAAAGMADLSEVQGRLTNIMKPKGNKPPNAAARWLLAVVVVTALTASPLLMARPGADHDLPDVFNQPINLELDDALLSDVLNTFSKVTNTPFKLSGNTGTRVTVSLNDKTVFESLNLLAKVNDLQWSVQDGVVHVYAPPKDAEPMLVGTHHGEEVFRFVEGVFEEPKKLGGPPPKYPEESRKARSQGIVLLDALITADGIVSDVVVKKSPDNLLSQAAMDAVEQWTFQPALLEGRPVAVRYMMTVRFNLQ